MTTGGIAIVGGGPAGLMAAEVASAGGARVTLYDRMPTLGRKLLMAGRGGLNLTHSEPLDAFTARYGAARSWMTPLLDAFPPKALIDWCEDLGQPVFTGSSGRVFPRALKASPLLRAWIARLQAQGVDIRTRHEFLGWDEAGDLIMRSPVSTQSLRPDATILALGGASWPRLGSNGAWLNILESRGIPVSPLLPANCGFTVNWSDIFRDRFAGTPLKNIALSFAGRTIHGEAMIAGYGIEGGAVYALGAALRDRIAATGKAVLSIDLSPNLAPDHTLERLSRPKGAQSAATFLRKNLGLAPVAINLLREAAGKDLPTDAAALARLIHAAPITLRAPQSLERAISTAGGVDLTALDENLMLRQLPGIFIAGEMLDWEAPTGGYLLQATLASGHAAGRGALRWLQN
jgi:uncharacterized flavoprotein (TIGR03862 family)